MLTVAFALLGGPLAADAILRIAVSLAQFDKAIKPGFLRRGGTS
jgi:hypothetical protein